MEWLLLVHRDTPKASGPTFAPGDEVRVWFKILEQGKERLGQFEGIVMRFRGAGPSKTFTVRRVTYGEGVERVFPVDSKSISRIEVLRKGHVTHSRLYFLRRVIGKTRIASTEALATSEQVSQAVPAPEKASGAEAEGAIATAGLPAPRQAGKSAESTKANT